MFNHRHYQDQKSYISLDKFLAMTNSRQFPAGKLYINIGIIGIAGTQLARVLKEAIQQDNFPKETVIKIYHARDKSKYAAPHKNSKELCKNIAIGTILGVLTFGTVFLDDNPPPKDRYNHPGHCTQQVKAIIDVLNNAKQKFHIDLTKADVAVDYLLKHIHNPNITVQYPLECFLQLKA